MMFVTTRIGSQAAAVQLGLRADGLRYEGDVWADQISNDLASLSRTTVGSVG